MKLTIQAQPQNYTADKACIMFDEDGNSILIGCADAAARAKEIARRVNFHDALVAALTPFKSEEMGKPILDALDFKEFPEPQQVYDRLETLIESIDAVLAMVEE